MEFNKFSVMGLVIIGLLSTSLLYQISIFLNQQNFPNKNIRDSNEQEWNQTYGGLGIDESSSLIQSSDGGFVLAGWTNSFGAGSRDMWLVKTDEEGIIQWNQTYGGLGIDESSSLIQSSDGGFVLAGRTNSFGWTNSFGAGVRDMWLVKTDEDGFMEWNQTYGGVGSDGSSSLIQSSDGGFVFTSTTQFTGGGVSDIWLVKTDEDGFIQWNQTYGGPNTDSAKSLIQSSDGGFVLAGTTQITGGGISDIWLVKTDEDGFMEWNQTYGGMDFDRPSSLIQSNDGGFVLAGLTGSFGAGAFDMWLVKTDEAGFIQWNQTYGGLLSDGSSSLIQSSDGGFVLVGSTNSFGAGLSDMWLVKTDEDGFMEWNQTYGGSNIDSAKSLIQSSDGGFVFAGWTESFGAGLRDMWLIKLSSLTKSPSTIEILLDKPIFLLTVILIVALTVYLGYRYKKIKAEKNLDSRLYPNP